MTDAYGLAGLAPDTVVVTVEGERWHVYLPLVLSSVEGLVLSSDGFRGPWMTGEIPAAAHTPAITATSILAPDSAPRALNLVWVEEWGTPLPPSSWYRVYPPVVLRSQ